MPTLQIEADAEFIISIIKNWMNGFSYIEMASACNLGIDEMLDILEKDIAFKLQASMASLTQLSSNHYGEDLVSELAINWPSLLQYGLANMQQLDLFDKGLSTMSSDLKISRKDINFHMLYFKQVSVYINALAILSGSEFPVKKLAK